MENPLDFSKRSRRAIFYFVVLLFIVVLIPRMYFLFSNSSKIEFVQTDFEKKVFQKRKAYTSNYKKKSYVSKFKVPPKIFDPNSYAPSDWMYLGLSQKQSDILIKFGKRGFYSDEDLKRVFVISDKFFAIIKDSLVYPEKVQQNFSKDKQITVRKVIEINTASEEELLSLPGIGPFFAKNIIKKREELGGFISKEQLLEIWKFDEEKLSSIQELIKIDATAINLLPLNSVTAEELKKHPYISWNIANSIVKLRAQLGEFQKTEDIKRSVLIDEELFNKLKPYLTL